MYTYRKIGWGVGRYTNLRKFQRCTKRKLNLFQIMVQLIKEKKIILRQIFFLHYYKSVYFYSRNFLQ